MLDVLKSCTVLLPAYLTNALPAPLFHESSDNTVHDLRKNESEVVFEIFAFPVDDYVTHFDTSFHFIVHCRITASDHSIEQFCARLPFFF